MAATADSFVCFVTVVIIFKSVLLTDGSSAVTSG